MRDNVKELYNKALEQIPVRKGKIKAEVMKKYNQKFNCKGRTVRFVGPVAVAMIVVLLAVVVLPKNNDLPLRVYAAEGEYVKLGKEAVSLKSKYEPYMLLYSTLNNKQKEDYSCVFYFDIQCEAENVESITYKIEGEKTYSHIAQFSENDVWFVKVSDKEFDQNSSEYPFDYRYMEIEGEKEIFTYVGSELVVEEDSQTGGNYYIEYKINKDDNGKLYAPNFEIQITLENEDGTTTEKKLECEPVFKLLENDINGSGIVNELWVSVE